MPFSVAVYCMTGHGRSKTVCEAMELGIRRCGDMPIMMKAENYRQPETEIAVFYGFTEQLQRCMRDHRARSGAVYIDLGYWGRHEGGRRVGFHKVSVNSRHPTAYFRKGHRPDRFLHHKIEIKPWSQRGRHILIAGMSAKAAWAEGFMPEAWEQAAIRTLREVTDRPLIYRPKPNWPQARPLNGAGYSPPTETLEEALRDCHAVVTHHSNVAVDALLAGVPVYAASGVAAPMGVESLAQIDAVRLPDDRLEWASDVAYCQWTVDEMARGLPWRHLKREGLVP